MISKSEEMNISHHIANQNRISVRVAGYSSESKYTRVKLFSNSRRKSYIPIKFLDIFSLTRRSASLGIHVCTNDARLSTVDPSRKH